LVFTFSPSGIDDLEQEDGNEEPDADGEPSLGSGAVGVHSTHSQWSQPGGGSDDREEDADDDREEENEHGDHADYEPSLGWPEGMAQGQGRWGGTDDRELSAGAKRSVSRDGAQAPQPQQHLQRHAGERRVVED